MVAHAEHLASGIALVGLVVGIFLFALLMVQLNHLLKRLWVLVCKHLP